MNVLLLFNVKRIMILKKNYTHYLIFKHQVNNRSFINIFRLHALLLSHTP
jgi:hypothetical protein